MICQNCIRWNLKKNDEMAKAGFGWCEKTLEGSYSGRNKPCDKNAFSPISDELREKREIYYEKRK